MKKEVEKEIPFCDVILVPSCDAFWGYQEHENIGEALKEREKTGKRSVSVASWVHLRGLYSTSSCLFSLCKIEGPAGTQYLSYKTEKICYHFQYSRILFSIFLLQISQKIAYSVEFYITSPILSTAQNKDGFRNVENTVYVLYSSFTRFPVKAVPPPELRYLTILVTLMIGSSKYKIILSSTGFCVNDSVNWPRLECVALVVKWLTNNALERIWKVCCCHLLERVPGGFKKSHKTEGCRCTVRKSNLTSPEYRPGALVLHQTVRC
jgi:hypothetical protein